MDDRVERLAQRGADARMVVAERGADLPGREIEDPPAVGRLDPGALRACDGEGREVADVADEEALTLVVHGASLSKTRLVCQEQASTMRTWQCASTTLSVPMARPTLSRIRRRAPASAARPSRRARRGSTSSPLAASPGFTSSSPAQLELRRARRALRLPRARRRGRPLEAAAAEDRRVPGLPLRRPPLPRLRQDDPAAERGRARRLPRPRLPDHAPERRAAARLAALQPLRGATPSCATSSSRRAPGYLLYHVLDDLFDYCFPILDKIGHKLDSIEDDMFEGAQRGGRPRHLEREAGDHLLPEDHQARARDAAAARAPYASGSSRRTSSCTSTTSSTPPSGSGTCSTTTRRSSRGSSRRTSRSSTHKQNDILRILTLFSVTILPLTLIAGIFGMNVTSPARAAHDAFWVDPRRSWSRRSSAWSAFFRWKKWL